VAGEGILATMKVADGIERVEGTRVGNAYVVPLEEGVLLVDTGMPGNASRVLAALERLGHRPGDVRQIVLTHWHPDHMGSAAELRRLTGAQVAIHELDAPVPGGRAAREGPADDGPRAPGIRVDPWSPMSYSRPRSQPTGRDGPNVKRETRP